MRVLFVIGSLEVGGAESQMVMLIRELIKKRIQCEVFALQTEGPLSISLKQIGVCIHSGRYRHDVSSVIKVLMLVRALWILWSKARYATVLHAYLPLTNFMGACAGRLAGVRTVITSRRGLGNHQDKYPLWKWIDRIANLLSDVVTVNAIAVEQDIIKRDGIQSQKITCIYNGIYPERFETATSNRHSVRQSLGLKEGQVTLIIVANLIPYKGHADMLNALAKIFPEFPDIRLLLVGQDRGIEKALQIQAENLGLAHAVQWLGLRNDIPDLLAAADIYVCASHEEGFSNSLLEAMAAGKAVIATKVGGNNEMLEDGVLGLLVEPHDTEGLVLSIKKLVTDHTLRARLGQMASSRITSSYGAEKMSEQYISLYQQGGLDCHDDSNRV
jgi:glycosyltransferase involved in cell wall biosynthesis